MKRGRSRRRRRGSRVVLYGGAIVLLTAVLGTAGLVLRKGNGAGAETEAESIGGLVSVEDHLAGTVTASEDTMAEGINITGLSRKAAEKLLNEKMAGIAVVWQDESVPADAEIKTAVSNTLDEIYADGRMKTGTYQLDSSQLEDSFRSLAKTLSGKWNLQPVDSQMESYDKETGVYSYSEAKPGRLLDEEALVQGLLEAVKKIGDGGGSGSSGSGIGSSGSSVDSAFQVKPVFSDIPPGRTAAQAKEQYRVIGSFTTETTNNRNRNENIRLAVEAIDGRILKPGEEFSFNLATGNRTKEKGYQPAGAYRNGVLIEEPGGGVCQVSTTLYNAVVNSGLQATERNSHSFTPSYIQPGQDAMVSFDGYAGPDLKFVNTESTTVAVRASLDKNTLKISIVGLPVLEDGVKVTMRSEKVRDVNQPAPVYEENDTLPAGSEKVVDQGKNGSVWKTFRVVTKDGKVVEETPLHSTTYRGKAAVIQKNEKTVEGGTEKGTGTSETGANEAGTGKNETTENETQNDVVNVENEAASVECKQEEKAILSIAPVIEEDTIMVPAFSEQEK